ncbi:CorA metal ion transporter [Ascosphaera aggregata]|nr:CorA metal ion transporter [Ascosphaera aggregata]
MDDSTRSQVDNGKNSISALRRGLAGGPSSSSRVREQDRGLSKSMSSTPRMKRHGRKRRGHRRQSFAFSPEASPDVCGLSPNDAESPQDAIGKSKPSFYRGSAGNLSDTSLDSQTLLDHRDQPSMRTRPRQCSSLSQSLRLDGGNHSASPEHLRARRHSNTALTCPKHLSLSRSSPRYEFNVANNLDSEPHDRTPLLSKSHRGEEGLRRKSYAGTTPSNRLHPTPRAVRNAKTAYNVNNPPSVPGSPPAQRDPARSFTHSPEHISPFSNLPYDSVIDVDPAKEIVAQKHSTPLSRPVSPQNLPSDGDPTRRHSMPLPAEEDVCFPSGGLSDIADEEQAPVEVSPGRRRRRRRQWPDLAALEDWSSQEKEERNDAIRAKRIDEPMFVEGRLRPSNGTWKRVEEDAPYRFTYFNEEVQSTIHSQTISGLLQPGQTFRDLFIPEPPELSSDSSDYDSDEEEEKEKDLAHPNEDSRLRPAEDRSQCASREHTPHPSSGPDKPKRYGPRPTFWLDVLSPSDAEMKAIAKAFGIHALTAEDIMVQEAREKVELFRHYYFINYRTFEQDKHSENYLEPVNMYVIVFREGLLSFHFSMIPHPANVRRRIRQLKDYLILSADWISYALIDDITDVFGPMIQVIEDEVDAIDDIVLRLYAESSINGKPGETYDYLPVPPVSGSDMLRRVGECRKKVMGLYRLLGNKADVIKGFAKRCNEYWDVAPKSEIGLYLGDIQDHIVTMTSNLSHYETLLSRAHSNYLAQININMNERQEKTADVLGKLTVLGTIVLPMNIITGMWGMNVKVPGQDIENLNWFFSITAGLFVFAVLCFYIAKRVYGIV